MAISKLLLNWYNLNQRDLPWRRTSDPYKIWVSEIILQQTRVSQGTDYYLNFIDKFPNIKTLAESEEIEVLKAWEGLGYYSRARNLRQSAIIIQEKYAGIFPDTYKEILGLKGIGPYTAGAIASIAYKLPYPAIDGNVKRVISRIFGLLEDIGSSTSYKSIEKIILSTIDKKDPGTFNQALMDFGSLICLPKNPECTNCILKDICFAKTNNMVQELPVSYKVNKQRQRAFHFFIITEKNKILINKRSGEDIWKGLYEFPLIEYVSIPQENEGINDLKKKYDLNTDNIKSISISSIHKHKLSHQNIEACFVHVEISGLQKFAKTFNFTLIDINQLHSFPFPRLIQRYLQHNF